MLRHPVGKLVLGEKEVPRTNALALVAAASVSPVQSQSPVSICLSL
jgi:hypothetical protein